LQIDLNPDVEHDTAWRQDMARIPDDEEAFAVPEVQMGTRSVVREALETVALTLLIFLAVRAGIQNFQVEGHSMDPTLQDGQYVLVNKLAYAQADAAFLSRLLPWDSWERGATGSDPSPDSAYLFGGPQRGDIIVFHAPQEDKDYVKRVIGLPDDVVTIKRGDGVYINDTYLPEPYIQFKPNYTWPDGEPVTIQKGYLLVLGDNRPNSDDSHIFGPIPIANVIGKAWFRYWPADAFGPLP
jgi:signal peptidase I